MTENIAIKAPKVKPQSKPDQDYLALDTTAFKQLAKGSPSDRAHELKSEQGVFPLAQSQRGLWFGEKIGPHDAIYNVAEYCEIQGEMKPALFRAALQQITVEAETTRLEIHDTDEGPRQILLDAYKGEFPFVDVSNEADPRAAARSWMMTELSAPVDLARDPLWVCALLKINDQCYYWYHRCHHVVLDGFGAGIIARRLADIYNALLAERDIGPTPFLPIALQLEHEASYRSSSRFDRDRDYWLEQLQSLPEPVSLTRHNANRAGGLRRSSAKISVANSRILRELGKNSEGSLPQVLISLFAAYIYRMTGADDLVFGMPVSARASKTMRSIPSMMANAVTIRLAMPPEQTLPQLFQQVAKTVRSSLRHQQYRYEDLRRELGLLGQGQQISWVGVNIEPFDYDLGFGGHTCLAENLCNGTVEDLTVFIYDRGDNAGLSIDLDANPALYTQQDLDKHRDRFCRLIDAVLAAPEQVIAKINLLDNTEHHQLMSAWNDTDHPLPNTHWPALFDAQVVETPLATALRSNDITLNYRELNQAINRLAHALLVNNIGAGNIVAIALPRNEWMPIALLAVLKTGAAYLPLDPTAPPERLALILEEGKPDLLLSTADIAAGLINITAKTLHLEELTLNDYPSHTPRHSELKARISGDTPAYVIYTSGSTGRPKGVIIEHRSLLNFLLAMQDSLALSPNDKFLALTTVAFDIAALELFLPLMTGASVHIADRNTAKDPAALAALIQRNEISIMQATPSHWQALLADHAEQISGVRPLVGGEALPSHLARKMRKLGHPVVNLYGPTETTIWSTLMVLDGDDLDTPPIGRPIWNTQMYVLDQAMQPVPVGAIGELFIGGAGVAQGYLHRPELTAERFISNPFGEGRLYRTGDLARWRADGVLDFLGRNDFQMKIRGFRIEAEDVEANIQRCSGVRQAVVTLSEDPRGEKRLAAYVVPSLQSDGLLHEIDTCILRAELEKSLPDYMIPTVFTVMEHLPTNVNGKLDRKALPQPLWQISREYIAPRNELESQLAILWAEVFEVEQVGIHDSFFDLGGDSLTAARMVARLRELMQRDIPLAAVFEASTIAELAQQLQTQREVHPLSQLLPLKTTGLANPLFCIHPVVGLSWAYAGLSRYLGTEQPIYGLQARGLEYFQNELPESIGEIAEEYIAYIRRVQAAGPYQLLGWSMGGLLAHEVARRLELAGEQVSFLAVLDAYPYVQKDSQPVPQQMDETQLVRSALTFMGFSTDAMGNKPTTMNNLTEFLCDEYDIANLPFVKEIQQSNSDIIASVRRIIENNLALSQRFVPGKLNTDMLFIAASHPAENQINEVLHQDPEIWQSHVGKLSVEHIDCHHQQMFDAAPLEFIGPLIANELQLKGRF